MKTIYEIFNPSDAYTMECDDFKVAAVAVAILGRGQYGIKGSPLLFGWDAFFEEQGIKLDAFIAKNLEAIATALDSVLIGNETDREITMKAVALMPEVDRENFLACRHDKLRSSINNIGDNAKAIAKSLRDKLQPT